MRLKSPKPSHLGGHRAGKQPKLLQEGSFLGVALRAVDARDRPRHAVLPRRDGSRNGVRSKGDIRKSEVIVRASKEDAAAGSNGRKVSEVVNERRTKRACKSRTVNGIEFGFLETDNGGSNIADQSTDSILTSS